MTTFPLKIVTADGLIYDGEAERIVVRSTNGDIAILAHHIDCVAALGMGRATLVDGSGNRRYAACIGGMLTVANGAVTLVPTTFEWAESIDIARAQASLDRAKKIIGNKDASATDIKLAEARLHRALVRRSVASSK